MRAWFSYRDSTSPHNRHVEAAVVVLAHPILKLLAVRLEILRLNFFQRAKIPLLSAHKVYFREYILCLPATLLS